MFHCGPCYVVLHGRCLLRDLTFAAAAVAAADDDWSSANLWPSMGLWCDGDKCLLVEMVR